ncbi:MAG: type VI secretion system tube protein Hcp [Pirellulaceae bacterium]|nr:type VI secretion system tube protein Hcp [Pirellulaceae bacterium]
MILVRIEGVEGDCLIAGFEGYFTAESFGFGVERELADSAKGGTADVNIGIGELQECTISKSMDTASAYLARKAISGSSCKDADVKFVEAITTDGGERFNVVYLAFKLDNVFVKSWSMSGDGDDRPSEDVALWYNKLAFVYYPTTDGKEFSQGRDCRWDQTKSKPWSEAKLPGTIEKLKA